MINFSLFALGSVRIFVISNTQTSLYFEFVIHFRYKKVPSSVSSTSRTHLRSSDTNARFPPWGFLLRRCSGPVAGASQARFCWSVWLNIWSRVRLKRESWKIGVREKRREREIAEEGDTLSLGVGWSSKRAVNRCITFVGPFPPNGEKYGHSN